MVVDIVDVSTISVDVDIVDEIKGVEVVTPGVLVVSEVPIVVKTSVEILAGSVVVVNIDVVIFGVVSAGAVVFVV